MTPDLIERLRRAAPELLTALDDLASYFHGDKGLADAMHLGIGEAIVRARIAIKAAKEG